MIKTILITTGLVASSLTFSAQNFVADPQLTDYRANQGESAVWVSHEDGKGGLGDVGSSGDTAFDEKGSARMRFQEKYTNDYSAKPGMTQVISGLPLNTEMTYSLYYCDKKGANSASTLYYGVREVVEGAPLTGAVIAENRVHVRDLGEAPRGEVKNCFRQVSMNFNSGAAGSVEIFSLMEVTIDDSGALNMSKGAEVRIDEFSVAVASDD